jgi:hypothetical protein
MFVRCVAETRLQLTACFISPHTHKSPAAPPQLSATLSHYDSKSTDGQSDVMLVHPDSGNVHPHCLDVQPGPSRCPGCCQAAAPA